jgi:hypothetical protein
MRPVLSIGILFEGILIMWFRRSHAQVSW